jgi:hypothetical protein
MLGGIMDYDYVVEVRSATVGTLEHHTFEDANSAYHVYRRLQDEYWDNDLITVSITEPE